MSEPERHVALLNALDQAVIASDTDGRIVYWNDAAEALYGWTAAEVRGRNVVDVTPADISREEASAIMEAIGAGEIWSGVFPVRDRSGNQFDVAVTDVPIIENGRVAGILGVSKRNDQASPLPFLASEFVKAVDRLWPGQVRLTTERGIDGATATVGDPHILQLLALLLMREVNALDDGEHVELSLLRPSEEVLAQFGVPFPASRCLYIRVARERPGTLREAMRTAKESHYAARLVGLAGGRLFSGTIAPAAVAMHLFLPLGI